MRPGRRAVLAAALAAVAGCGFRPLYGEGGGGGALFGEVAIEGLSGRFGYQFRQAMRRRVGDPGGSPRYVLEIAFDVDEEGLAISPDNEVTRIDFNGAARWTLRRRDDGAELFAGVARSTSAYNTTGTPYATRIAADYAERRVAQDLAERIFAEIAGRIAPDGAAPAG